MLPHPTHDRLIALGLVGMAKAFEEQRAQPVNARLKLPENRRFEIAIVSPAGAVD